MSLTALALVFAIVAIVLLATLLFSTINIKNTMATKADLDAVIAGLPAALETAITTAVQPVIDAINAKAGDIDFTQEIADLNALGGTVGSKVAADLTPKPAPAP